MKINLSEHLATEKGMTVIVPCTGDENLAKTLDSIIGGAGDQIAHGCDTEETWSAVIEGVRFDIVGIKGATYAAAQKALQMFLAKNSKRLGSSVNIILKYINSEDVREGAVNGAILGTYNFGMYKTDIDSTGIGEMTFIVNTEDNELIARARDTAETQKSIFDLVNAPSNHKSPQTLADWAVASGEINDYNVTIIEEDDLKKQGFHGLLAVNRGSEHPARFIISDYNPKGATRTIALVGKGVTFDTGGISIKPSNNMHLMKSDMGGAAAVLGAVELIAKRKAPIRVIGFVPTTDNSVGTRAIKPGDVISSYSGKTIEVINTDAEGRLILADALAYAVKNYKPDVMVDLATLTGSVVRTLGSNCAGLFTHDDDLANKLIEAGEGIGERLWRLPLWDEYAEEMRSEIADIKNLSDKPVAGAITAAKFLETFTGGHEHWAHIDIAGTAFKNNGVSRTHAATAFGVRLLHDFALAQSQN